MPEKNNCKGCSASVNVTEEKIKEMLNIIIEGKEAELVQDFIYKQRLNQCIKCQYLEYGTTCLQCGCIVQIRAKLKELDCPYPAQSKWRLL